MPWWAWLVVDVVLVVLALGVLARVGWVFFRRVRAFARMLGGVLDQLPQVERPSR